jgi:hypothetical protein
MLSRPELQFRLPVGFRWAQNGKVELDPDRRVQQAILLWFRGEKTSLPSLVAESPGHDVIWKLPVYNTIWHMLRNPLYAGAYAFGKTESRTSVVDGRARKRSKPSACSQWQRITRGNQPDDICCSLRFCAHAKS